MSRLIHPASLLGMLLACSSAPWASGQAPAKQAAARPSPSVEAVRPSASPEAETTLPRPHELSGGDEKDATDGLTLDQAIELLLHQNYQLRIKYQEIPKARADILSAGLRNNPALFFSVDGIPYGSYSEQRPGETSFDTLTIVQPTDISGKRRWRIRLAQSVKNVLEAVYQDSVRQEIDKLYTAYVNVLEAASRVRIERRALALFKERVEMMRGLVGQGLRPQAELTSASMQQAQAEVVLRGTEAALLQARREVAILLALTPERADCLRLHAALPEQAPDLPCPGDLIRIALQARPDLTARRLNVERAHTAVRRTQAERIENVLPLYTPYQVTTFPGQTAKAASGWEVGILAVAPVFDRKQGDIAQARIEVSQTQTEVQGAEQLVIEEVRRAAAEYEAARQSVARYRGEIMPAAGDIRAEKQRLYAKGQASLEIFLNAQRDYNETERLYQEALVRQRRAMLRINTVLGQRILP